MLGAVANNFFPERFFYFSELRFKFVEVCLSLGI